MNGYGQDSYGEVDFGGEAGAGSDLAATVVASSVFGGDLGVSGAKQLAATVTASSAFGGDIAVAKIEHLATSIVAMSGAAASLKVWGIRRLAAHIEGGSSASLDLTAFKPEHLAASIGADSSVAAALGTQRRLFSSVNGTVIRVMFPEEVRVDGLDAQHIIFQATLEAYPLTINSIEIVQPTKASGTGVIDDSGLLVGTWPGTVEVGDYATLNGVNAGQYRIVELLPGGLRFDRPVTPTGTEQVIYQIQSAVTGLLISTSKATNGSRYVGTLQCYAKDGTPRRFSGNWTAIAEKPVLAGVQYGEDGTLLVQYGEPMRFDPALTAQNEYRIVSDDPLAPPVQILDVRPVSSTEVVLQLGQVFDFPYRLIVNAAGTPKDAAGNPIDPLFNTAIFSASTPVTTRSIFTDRGPIARPPLVIREGVNATFVTFTDVQVPVGTMAADVVGRYLKLTGTTKNDGDYLVTAVLGANRVRVKASFSLPDATPNTWSVYDPRDGQIADDPSHVTVRVNGTPVQPEGVIGLLGQIVLPFTPAPTDDVKVDYSWVCNPTVDFARLNSKEFRFNNWNRDNGRPTEIAHKYRYNNVMVEPSTYSTSKVVQAGATLTVTGPGTLTLTGANLLAGFVGLTLHLTKLVAGVTVDSYYRIDAVSSTTTLTVSPATLAAPYLSWEVLDQASVVPADLPEPYNRELHYRAYEREYTAILNDPNLLVFNSPIHKIAYPPMERKVEASFVSYDPTTLPESYLGTPWQRLGAGTTSIVAGELYVQDTQGGPFPTGEPLVWRRTLDLTFPNVLGLGWRMYVGAVTAYQGVFTGVAAGYSTDKRAIVVGYIEVGGVRKFGVLRQGYGDNPGDPAAWIGGIDSLGDATYAPVDVDWSVVHSYRLFRSKDGIVKVYLDGEVVETLRVYEEDLPYLEELAAPFNELQQVFWGSISRPAINQSVWGFFRYQVIPTNPYQTAPSIFASYEGTTTPETASDPWTPVGFHGNEVVQAANYLLVNSTSATNIATEGKAGLVGGDFRGYMRVEPLLAASSDVVLDVDLRGITSTHGLAPNAVMAAIDDGDRLTQLSFLTSKAAPKLGWGGRSFPTAWSPTPWSAMGTAAAEMLGRILRITDTSATDGLIYRVFDTASPTGATRVFASTLDYAMEVRCQVRSFTPDGSGFAGAFADLYDGGRVLGVLLQEVAGVRQVALHSDGTVVSAWAFEWFDGKPHTYRLIKRYDTVSATDVVSLFVDGDFLGATDYTLFSSPGAGLTGVLSFGSTPFLTPSYPSQSVVDWHYANSWRIQTGQKNYVGLWRGTYSANPLSYPWSTKASGTGTATTNLLSDPAADFSAVVPGDILLVDTVGPNRGTYRIASIVSSTVLAVEPSIPFPVQPATISYRIPDSTEWVLWQNTASSSLIDYHLPLKAKGTVGSVAGNTLTDTTANFVVSVVSGDVLVVDTGINQGTYEIIAVTSPSTLVVNASTPFPGQPTGVILLLNQPTGTGAGTNVLTDLTVNFVSLGVSTGNFVEVAGTYYGVSAVTPTTLTLTDTLPGADPFTYSVRTSIPGATVPLVYRIPAETDWTTYHRYRVSRTPAGSVAVILDSNVDPLIQVGYNATELPSSRTGVPFLVSGGLPSIVWGAFDPTNLSTTSWDYVRYGITRAPTELRIVPHHQVQNQRNVIASPEHLRTSIPHPHTDFWSSSTGIPPQTDPDVMRNPGLTAFTQLNDGTPLVPWTQTVMMSREQYLSDVVLFSGTSGQSNNSRLFTAPGVNFTTIPGLLAGATLVIRSGSQAGSYTIQQIAPAGPQTLLLDRPVYGNLSGLEFFLHPSRQGQAPTPIREFISAFNRPEDVLNRDGDFRLNDGATRWKLLVPSDVLYNSLEVIEQVTGQQNLIAPFEDECGPRSYALEWQKEVCLQYDGDTLPENAPNQPTAWAFDADNPIHVNRSSIGGILTFGTDITGTRTIYRNPTPLTDSPSLSTQITYRMRVTSDGTFGLGDSQIRLGFSAIGMTLALAFVTYPTGPRYVVVLDLNSKIVLGGIQFDFLDGAFHTYQIVRNPGLNTVTVTVVS